MGQSRRAAHRQAGWDAAFELDTASNQTSGYGQAAIDEKPQCERGVPAAGGKPASCLRRRREGRRRGSGERAAADEQAHEASHEAQHAGRQESQRVGVFDGPRETGAVRGDGGTDLMRDDPQRAERSGDRTGRWPAGPDPRSRSSRRPPDRRRQGGRASATRSATPAAAGHRYRAARHGRSRNFG